MLLEPTALPPADAAAPSGGLSSSRLPESAGVAEALAGLSQAMAVEAEELVSPRRRTVEQHLAAGWAPEDVPALQEHQGFHSLFPLFLALTRGSNEAGFVVRVTFVRELFAHCRDRFWDKETMARALPWLASEALDQLVSTFRTYGWLDYDRSKGYSWTDLGVNAAAMLGMLAQAAPRRQELGLAIYGVEFCLQMGYDPLDVLYNLRARFDAVATRFMEALESHSEVRLLEAQDELEACLALSAEARRVLDQLDLTRKDIQLEYQSIHQHLSHLHAYRSELIRTLTSLGEQFVTLDGGVSMVDITRALMEASVEELAAIAAEAFRAPAFLPPLFDPALLVAAAEYHLHRELIEVEEEQWSEPVQVQSTAPAAAGRETIGEAVQDLEQVARRPHPTPLWQYLLHEDPGLVMYRLSLLPLVGTPVAPGERTDSPVQRLKLVPLQVSAAEGDERGVPMLQSPAPGIVEITEAYLRPHPQEERHGRAS